MLRNKNRILPLIGAATLVAVFATGCSQQIRAERDGRDLAEDVCDLRNASDGEATQEAVDEILGELDEIIDSYGAATAEDRADIQNNLADLLEHAVQGNDALMQQDIAVLQRSASNIKDDATAVQDSVWTGFVDGLNECAT